MKTSACEHKKTFEMVVIKIYNMIKTCLTNKYRFLNSYVIFERKNRESFLYLKKNRKS